MIDIEHARRVMAHAIEEGWAQKPVPSTKKEQREALAAARRKRHADSERQRRAGRAVDASAIRAINWFAAEVERRAKILKNKGTARHSTSIALKELQGRINRDEERPPTDAE